MYTSEGIKPRNPAFKGLAEASSLLVYRCYLLEHDLLRAHAFKALGVATGPDGARGIAANSLFRDDKSVVS